MIFIKDKNQDIGRRKEERAHEKDKTSNNAWVIIIQETSSKSSVLPTGTMSAQGRDGRNLESSWAQVWQVGGRKQSSTQQEGKAIQDSQAEDGRIQGFFKWLIAQKSNVLSRCIRGLCLQLSNVPLVVIFNK